MLSALLCKLFSKRSICVPELHLQHGTGDLLQRAQEELTVLLVHNSWRAGTCCLLGVVDCLLSRFIGLLDNAIWPCQKIDTGPSY